MAVMHVDTIQTNQGNTYCNQNLILLSEGKVSFCTDVSSSEFVELLSYDSFCIQVTVR